MLWRRRARGAGKRFGATDVVVREFKLPDLAVETIARRVVFNLVVKGSRESGHLDYTILRQGKAVAGVVTSGLVAPFKAADRLGPTRTLAERLLRETAPSGSPPAVPPPLTTVAPSQHPRTLNVVGTSLPKARAIMLDAGFIAIKAENGAGKGRVPAFDDASWTVRSQSPIANDPLPNLGDVVLILNVTRAGERYTPTTSPCPLFAQC